MTRLLKNRSFVFFWLGQSFSQIGDRVYAVALAWRVYELSGSAATMATVMTFFILPHLICLLWGGVVVDRIARKWILLVCDAARGICVLVMGLLDFQGLLTVGGIGAASAIFGVASAFFGPAFTVAIREIAREEKLVKANALCSFSSSLSGLLGPLIGAFLVQTFSAGSAFIFDALSFGVAVFSLPFITWLPVAGAQGSHSPGIKELRAGLFYVVSITWLWTGILFAAISQAVFSALMQVVLPLYVMQGLGGQVTALGSLMTALGLGAILSSILLGNKGGLKNKGGWFYGSMALMSVVFFCLGFVHSRFLAAASFFLIGFFINIGSIVWKVALQEHIRPDFLGRAASVDMFGSYILLPLAYILMGALSQRGSVSSVFFLSGALLMGLSVAGLLMPTARFISSVEPQ